MAFKMKNATNFTKLVFKFALMKSFSKILNYVLILVGASVAIYAQAGEQQDTVILIVGIMVLMLGIYRISKNIGDRPKGPEGFVQTEEDDTE